MKMHRPPLLCRQTRTALTALALAVSTACGGGSAAGPSSNSSGGVVLRGSVLGLAGISGASALSSSVASVAGALTVRVQESPAMSTTVGSDGSFTFRGLPTGSFTLAFTRDGIPLGTVNLGAVLPNQELTITVSVTSGSVVLLEEQRNGIGHGDVEIEGLVEQVVSLNGAGDSRFLIDRRTVVARATHTAIREGNALRSVSDLLVGQRVHVKGVWLPVEGATQPVLASEIKIQGRVTPTPTATPTPTVTPTPIPTASCMINGGSVGRGIELEGVVLGGGASNFQLRVNGNRSANPVTVLAAGGASFECTPRSGPNAPTPEQCRALVAPGAQVHVTGILDACGATSAQVTASKVAVQK